MKFFKKIIVFLLEKEAILILKKYKPRIIAITGSIGKTSTKDAIAKVLEGKYFVRKSQKSFNSDLGVPLTILDCDNAWYNPVLWLKNIIQGLIIILFPNHYPNCLVLEVGTDRPGDIKSIARWLRPDVVVFNKIGETPAHVEFFSSREDVIREKLHLVKALKVGGLLVVNGDDEGSLRAIDEASLAKVFKFGFSENNDLMASNCHTTFLADAVTPSGVAFKIEHQGSNIPVRVENLFGCHNVYSILGAISVGIAEGINIVNIVDSLSLYEPPRGRLRLIKGINDSFVFDDTYNSSPSAAMAAVKFVGELPDGPRKMCVLGDMLELGKYTDAEHKNLGREATSNCDILIAVGHRAAKIGEGFCGNRSDDLDTKYFHFDDSVNAGEYIKTVLQKHDYVLVKGSQFMRMERIVERIMNNPEDKTNLLVRQESDWINKK